MPPPKAGRSFFCKVQAERNASAFILAEITSWDGKSGYALRRVAHVDADILSAFRAQWTTV